MCLSICSDGSILKRYRNHTYTPILVRLLNLPPHLRTTATGVLMWAELPPGVANFKSIYRYLIGRIKDTLDPELGDLDRQTFNPVMEGGMLVYDAHAESHGVRKRKVRFEMPVATLERFENGLADAHSYA